MTKTHRVIFELIYTVANTARDRRKTTSWESRQSFDMGQRFLVTERISKRGEREVFATLLPGNGTQPGYGDRILDRDVISRLIVAATPASPADFVEACLLAGEQPHFHNLLDMVSAQYKADPRGTMEQFIKAANQ